LVYHRDRIICLTIIGCNRKEIIMNTARKIFWEKFYQNPHGHISDIYEKRGEVHRLVGKYDKALFDFSKNLIIGEILKDKKRKAKAISQIGNVYLHKSDFKNAEIRFNDWYNPF